MEHKEGRLGDEEYEEERAIILASYTSPPAVAANAPPTNQAQPTNQAPPTDQALQDDLARLDMQRRDGRMDDAEYEEERALVIASYKSRVPHYGGFVA